MNIIDRSPLKTSTQEALWTQSTRRMNEAKTAAEKSSIVQNFAEQLRLEKLRAKRLQENMRELNEAITNPNSASASASAPIGQASAASASANAPKFSVLDSAVGGGGGGNTKIPIAQLQQQSFQQQNQQNASLNWTDPYATNFGLVKSGSGNVNTFGSASKDELKKSGVNVNVKSEHRSTPYLGTHFSDFRISENGVSLMEYLKKSKTTQPSRPLNVHAPPFVMQPKSPSSSMTTTVNRPDDQPPLYQLKLAVGSQQQVPLRRVSMSPPVVTSPPIVAAVAPKSAMFALRQQTTTRPTIDGRQRSLSIGAQEKPDFDLVQKQKQQQQQQPKMVNYSADLESKKTSDGGRERMVYNQRSQLAANYNQNDQFLRQPPSSKFDGFPKPHLNQHQPEESLLKNKRSVGSVKIENNAFGGASLLPDEDWDSEYVQTKQEEPKRERQQQICETFGIENRIGYAPPISSERKDWVSVLKEREDISNRRYTSEVMLRLAMSEASKIRPPCLSPEFNNSVGLWCPDLWFHVTFQIGQPPQPPQAVNQRSKFGNNGGRQASSVDSAYPQLGPGPISGLRRVSCLSAYHEKKEQEAQQQQEQRWSSN